MQLKRPPSFYNSKGSNRRSRFNTLYLSNPVSSWFKEWKSYLHQAGTKRGSSAATAAAHAVQAGGAGTPTTTAAAAAAALPPLPVAMREVLCRCPEHAGAPLLAVKTPAVINKRGRCVRLGVPGFWCWRKLFFVLLLPQAAAEPSHDLI